MDSTLPRNSQRELLKYTSQSKRVLSSISEIRNPAKFENFQFIMIDFTHFIKQTKKRESQEKQDIFQLESFTKQRKRLIIDLEHFVKTSLDF